MASLFPAEQRFIDNNGRMYGISHLAEKKRIGLYFSAHWCPPCRKFTPKLVQAYNVVGDEHPGEFEVVFVSSDRDEATFKEYFSQMPWLALPFNDPRIHDMRRTFNVTGIPHFVVVDAEGKRVTTEGRKIVLEEEERTSYRGLWERLTI
eukprot:TRINITY_DN4753_c0_g1_i1.p2 TRINITY_DN4753_c0_g1~~TRINITY_DN4753_c0_g1_i1.p2  ORF type:complete len:156 (-),score=27.03 TRINITY_DN4753_c0_g1_i1:14-460(-)